MAHTTQERGEKEATKNEIYSKFQITFHDAVGRYNKILTYRRGNGITQLFDGNGFEISLGIFIGQTIIWLSNDCNLLVEIKRRRRYNSRRLFALLVFGCHGRVCDCCGFWFLVLRIEQRRLKRLKFET
jgi:hypothetical protein